MDMSGPSVGPTPLGPEPAPRPVRFRLKGFGARILLARWRAALRTPVVAGVKPTTKLVVSPGSNDDAG